MNCISPAFRPYTRSSTMWLSIQFAIVVVCSGIFVRGQSFDPSLCRAQKSCGRCQTSHPLCRWCSDVPFDGSPRCDTQETLQSAGCRDVENVFSTISIKDARPVSNVLRFTPQRVEANVYKNRPISFPVRVKVPRTRRLSLRVRNPTPFADISISSQCRRARGTGTRLTCPSVTAGEVITFIVTVNVKFCQTGNVNRITLKASNIRGRVRLDLKDKCTCGCEFYSVLASSDSSEYCNDNGETLCGLCHCYPGYNGERCECRKSEYDVQCTPSDGEEVCSGNGECICGHCSCSKISITSVALYTGQYCECDDTSCPEYDGKLCGGSSRGRCVCGQCQCLSDHVGMACETIQSEAGECVSQSGMLCNGHGMCSNGQCECDGVWDGPRCEDCPTCPARCQSLRPCVQCWMFQSGPLTHDECQAKCSSLDFIFVNNIDLAANVGTKICDVRDVETEEIQYVYLYNEDGSMHILVNGNASM